MSSPEHKEKIWDMIKKIKVGMLTTELGSNLHARPMHNVQSEYDGRLWFFTNLQSETAFEVNRESKVGVTYQDVGSEVYVSLTGDAKISKDKALIEKFWNPFVAAWFPEGKDSPNVALIEIHVRSGEHWDATSSRLLQLFEIAKANLTKTIPDMGENEKFGVAM